MNMSAIARRTPDCWINPAEVCNILYKKIFEWVKNLTHTLQEHSMWTFPMSQNELLCVRLQWQAGAQILGS